MGTLETLASKLADDTLKVMDKTGEDRLYMEVAALLAASSQSLEEAFLTEMRVRLSERIARGFLNRKLAEAASATPQAPPPKAG